MKGTNFKIVGLGEVLFDILPTGEKMPGGAPANFAYVCRQLGNTGILASGIGADEPGTELIGMLSANGLDLAHLQNGSGRPTGTVRVSLIYGQPAYEITSDVAWDHLVFDEDWKDLAGNCDAVCFGTLAQRSRRSRETIRNFLRSTAAYCKRVFDINLRENFFDLEIIRESLQITDILKLNADELPVLIEFFDLKGSNEAEISKNVLEKFKLELVCLTRGDKGSLLITDNEISEHSGFPANVVNTIGAGDSFTAALTHGLLQGWDLDLINENANRVGAYVASKNGAMPDFNDFFMSPNRFISSCN